MMTIIIMIPSCRFRAARARRAAGAMSHFPGSRLTSASSSASPSSPSPAGPSRRRAPAAASGRHSQSSAAKAPIYLSIYISLSIYTYLSLSIYIYIYIHFRLPECSWLSLSFPQVSSYQSDPRLRIVSVRTTQRSQLHSQPDKPSQPSSPTQLARPKGLDPSC